MSQIDRDRAAALGVTPQQIETALGAAFGGQQVSQIYAAVQPVSGDAGAAAAIPARCLRAATGSMSPAPDGTLVPLTAVTTITTGTMPLSDQPSGQMPAVTISFDLAPGYALSDAVTGIDRGQRRYRHARIPSRAASRAPPRPSSNPPRIWACCCDRHDRGLHHPGHSL